MCVILNIVLNNHLVVLRFLYHGHETRDNTASFPFLNWRPPLRLNIYILIALALDESIILDVPQFPMQNIYQSCDLGRAIGRRNVNASQ